MQFLNFSLVVIIFCLGIREMVNRCLHTVPEEHYFSLNHVNVNVVVIENLKRNASTLVPHIYENIIISWRY